MTPDVKILAVHASGGDPRYETVEGIRRYHMAPKPDGRGFNDIGYHWLVDREGERHQGRPENVMGAHVRGWNDRSLGICLLGGQHEFDFPHRQLRGLHLLLGRLLIRYPTAIVCGHVDFPGVRSRKACPRFCVRTWFYGDAWKANPNAYQIH